MAAPSPDLALGEPSSGVTPSARSGVVSAAAEHIAVVVALLTLIGPVANNEGGRGPGATAAMAVTTLAAIALTRPWQRVTGRGWLLAPGIALAAFYTLTATGGGRPAAVAAAGYAVAAGLSLAIVSYARTPARRAAVAGLLAAGGVAEFGWALVPWWGGRNPSRPMVGTYYWHNQLAVALLLPALLGVALAVAGRRPWRAAGWVAAPLCAAGVVLSTSRATSACLIVGWLAVVAVATATAVDRRAALVRGVVVTAAAAALTLALPGPPLFDARVSPLAGASARAAAGESVDANTTYRTQFWREAGSVTAANPWTGAGYGRLAQASAPITPQAWAHSPLAHSGPLQAFADGGLPLGGALLAGLVLASMAVVRRLWAGVRAATRFRAVPAAGAEAAADAALTLAVAVCALLLVAHSMVDLDWTYPGLAAQFAVVVGVALAGRAAPAVTRPVGARGDLAAAVGSAVLVLLLALAGAATWGQSFHVSAPPTVTGKVHQ